YCGVAAGNRYRGYPASNAVVADPRDTALQIERGRSGYIEPEENIPISIRGDGCVDPDVSLIGRLVGVVVSQAVKRDLSRGAASGVGIISVIDSAAGAGQVQPVFGRQSYRETWNPI